MAGSSGVASCLVGLGLHIAVLILSMTLINEANGGTTHVRRDTGPRPRPPPSHISALTLPSQNRSISTHGKSPQATMRHAPGDSFFFPDELPNPSKDKTVSRITTQIKNAPIPPILGTPKCAQGKTFCQKIDNYPRDYINSLISKSLHEFKETLQNDELEESGIQHKVDPNSEKSLCASIESIETIEAAQAKGGDWFYIVNHENFTQNVRIEKCLESEANDCDRISLGYKTTCKQKHIYRRLLAVGADGALTPEAQFAIPSCCSCVMSTNLLSGDTSNTGNARTRRRDESRRNSRRYQHRTLH